MERRKAKRIAVHGEIKGGIISLDVAELCDLSTKGARFNFSQKLDNNAKYTLAIRHIHIVLHLKGKVVRSRIIEEAPKPIYEISMAFERYPPEKEDIIKGFFLHL